VNCRLCAQEIPDGAKKCSQCGEFQSTWSRALAIVDLKGLMALLPLLTLIYAFLAERFETQSSDLRLTAVSCSLDGVKVFGSNTGNRSAILLTAGFSTGEDQSEFVIPESPEERVFDAGASRLLTLPVDARRNPGGLVPHDLRSDPACSVELQFSVVEFDHTTTRSTSSCACPSA